MCISPLDRVFLAFLAGVCTRGVCACYRGFAGPECENAVQHTAPATLPAAQQRWWQRSLTIAVVTTGSLRISLSKELDGLVRAAPLAKALAKAGHSVQLLQLRHNVSSSEQDEVSSSAWQAELERSGVTVDILNYTHHYYLPTPLTHSFEAYAWLCDRHAISSKRPFDTVVFVGGHGLAYYTALAKHQDLPQCRFRGSKLVLALEHPHLWRITRPGSPGLESVDDLEVNFAESESVRLADHVVLPGADLPAWMAKRNWKLPWSTFIAPQPPAASTSSGVHNASKGLWGQATLALQQFRQPTRQLPLVSVVITHYNRPALLPFAVQSIVQQDYPAERIQLVVVDDGSPDPTVAAALDKLEADLDFQARGWLLLREPNRYLGGARNRGVEACAGEFVLFMDDDNYAKPHEVSTFVHAMESTGADILTSFVDFLFGEGAPLPANQTRPLSSQSQGPDLESDARSLGFVFLGSSPEVGIFKNCFGDANSFVRRDAFLSLGGYSTDRGIGYEDWELYAKAVLKGYLVEVVPLPLYHYRFTAESMQKSTSFSASRRRALRPYKELLVEYGRKHSSVQVIEL
ncbi:hypothetical protein WJX72_007378 [[Myrmecia] bisecta]|uniref:Glycosyltransferase 2-like domain-containing protein n=1 Tax=[Myrmecia] bisecta TaxID=41462 RepID=A0AAW1PEE0_9CHLO